MHRALTESRSTPPFSAALFILYTHTHTLLPGTRTGFLSVISVLQQMTRVDKLQLSLVPAESLKQIHLVNVHSGHQELVIVLVKFIRTRVDLSW